MPEEVIQGSAQLSFDILKLPMTVPMGRWTLRELKILREEKLLKNDKRGGIKNIGHSISFFIVNSVLIGEKKNMML